MWKSKIINIGTVIVKENVVVTFNFIGECEPQEVRIKASCGCTSARWNETKKELSIMYKVSNIPRHLSLNQINIRKSIKMIYICNGTSITDVLIIEGIAKK